MQRRTYFPLFILVIISLATSCVKDVDFDQAEDVVLTPVITSSALFTEVEASRFSENGMELETVRDSIANIEIFTDQFVIDNLVKVELVFEVSNSINRTFGLQIEFLNEADELQNEFSFDALPSPSGNDVLTEFTAVFEDESLEALKTSQKMVITLSLYPSTDGTFLNENSTGKIGLKSKGLFYFNISL
ncbi:hypothetical protein [Winogradskyella flava]|uniref:Uncharacterized protein n=1 Tax=Winogradskyella flava TaxID=1884876 RepID=A0A842IRX2_9FLAO|nr:hypothetical protein [Winogradskyella flava]MBC2844524.1 hypothetical protein [Winogradskyella flava]